MYLANSWPVAVPSAPLKDPSLSLEAIGLFAQLAFAVAGSNGEIRQDLLDGAQPGPLHELISKGYIV